MQTDSVCRDSSRDAVGHDSAGRKPRVHFWPVLPEVGIFFDGTTSGFGRQSLRGTNESQTGSLSGVNFWCMPWTLERFYKTGGLHFLTWSCRGRLPLLGTGERRGLLLKVIEQMRNRYRFGVVGYVVMPEHVHLLISEPLIGDISSVVCAVKLGFIRRVMTETLHFWQNRPEVGHPDSLMNRHMWLKRFYDFNVWSQRKETEKLHYMHQNPSPEVSLYVRRTGSGAVFEVMQTANRESFASTTGRGWRKGFAGACPELEPSLRVREHVPCAAWYWVRAPTDSGCPTSGRCCQRWGFSAPRRMSWKDS
jgi:putative transposase